MVLERSLPLDQLRGEVTAPHEFGKPPGQCVRGAWTRVRAVVQCRERLLDVQLPLRLPVIVVEAVSDIRLLLDLADRQPTPEPPSACTVPAGIKKQSPERAGCQRRSDSMAPSATAADTRSRLTGSANPAAIFAPGSARSTYHISVLPVCPPLSAGCTCTERFSLVKRNLTRMGRFRSRPNQTSPIFFTVSGNHGCSFVDPQGFSNCVALSRTGFNSAPR
jgi:hypothetical protein